MKTEDLVLRPATKVHDFPVATGIDLERQAKVIGYGRRRKAIIARTDTWNTGTRLGDGLSTARVTMMTGDGFCSYPGLGLYFSRRRDDVSS